MADDIGTELRGWLIQQPALVAMLDKDDKNAPRIHPAELPQSAGQYPKAIVYHLISDVSENSMQGVVEVSHAILQFDCYGPTPLIANRIRTQLKRTLNDKRRGQVGNILTCGIVHDGDRDETDGPQDGSAKSRFIRMCDYKISYQNTEISS